MILGCPFGEKNLGKIELSRIGSPRDFGAKWGIFEVKRRFSLGQLQLLSKLENPAADHAQSVEGYIRRFSQMCPWLRPFLAGLYAFFENRMGFAKNGQKISDRELKIWASFLKSHPPPHPRELFAQTGLKSKSTPTLAIGLLSKRLL